MFDKGRISPSASLIMVIDYGSGSQLFKMLPMWGLKISYYGRKVKSTHQIIKIQCRPKSAERR